MVTIETTDMHIYMNLDLEIVGKVINQMRTKSNQDHKEQKERSNKPCE